MRKWVVLVMLGMMVCGVRAQQLSDLAFGTEETFEVATWNIEWFPKHVGTADSVQRIMASLDLDVYALQEIEDTTLLRQVVDGLDGYELHIPPGYFAGLCYVYKTSTLTDLSIYKIYDTSSFWYIFPRSPVVFECTFKGKRLIVINNHWKCCGDGVLNLNSNSDEETRRYNASQLLKTYIDTNFADQRVILLGDLNDILTDVPANNVFQNYLDDSTHYRFLDLEIAQGSSNYWSYPNWPSHLDHMLVTNEVVNDFAHPLSEIATMRIGDYLFNGFWTYDAMISDHRPVVLKLGWDEEPTLPLASDGLLVYPNPTKGKFRLGNATTGEVFIYDVRGKLIGQIALTEVNQTLDLSVLEAGVYLLRARLGGQWSAARVVIDGR